MRGIEALVQGFKDGGVEYTSNYPGYFSHDIFIGLGGSVIAANEKAAFETAWGACLAGARAVVTMKNVGLSACADQFLHAVVTGVNAGLVLVVTDDTKVVASQERQDSRSYFDFNGGLWLEPSTVQMAYDMAYEAFTLSERFDVPVVIRLTSQFFDLTESYSAKKRSKPARKKLLKNPSKFVAYPNYWWAQHESMHNKNQTIQTYIDSLYEGSAESLFDVGEIIVGCNSEEQAKYVAGSTDVLVVNHYPLPMAAIQKFTEQHDDVIVLEQGNAYVADKVYRAYGNELLHAKVRSITGDSPDRAHTWQVWSHLEKIFAAIKAVEPSYVVGDVGQYTVETQHVVDACLCLGSSVGTTLGLALNDVAYPLCVVGDGAFTHGNLVVLQEAYNRKAAFGVIVLDNGGSQATGGQPLVIDTMEMVHGDIPVYDIAYNDTSIDEIAGVLQKMRAANKLAVLRINTETQNVYRKAH